MPVNRDPTEEFEISVSLCVASDCMAWSWVSNAKSGSGLPVGRCGLCAPTQMIYEAN